MQRRHLVGLCALLAWTVDQVCGFQTYANCYSRNPHFEKRFEGTKLLPLRFRSVKKHAFPLRWSYANTDVSNDWLTRANFSFAKCAAWRLGDRDWEVHKFGGHSLATGVLYQRAASLVVDHFEGSRSNKTLVVVANAMDGVDRALAGFLNDSLLDLHTALYKLDEAAQLQSEVLAALKRPDITDTVQSSIDKDVAAIKDIAKGLAYLESVPREVSTVVNEVGHKWSAQTLHAVLEATGAPTLLLNAPSVITVADLDRHGHDQYWDPDHESPTMEVRPKWRETSQNLATWWHRAASRDSGLEGSPQIVVVAGSTARSPRGSPATLGAGGSDLTASLLSRVLGAQRLFIWKGQDGIFSADPVRVPEAFPIAELEFDEAMEMFCFGHPVMHPSALAPCGEANMQVVVRNIYSQAGTVINCAPRSHPPPSTHRAPVEPPQLSSPSSPPLAHTHGLAGCKAVTCVDEVALISVEGPDLGHISAVADRFLASLSGRGIRVLMLSQASSDGTLCVAVPKAQCGVAVSALRGAFALELTRRRNRIAVTSGMSITAIFHNGMAWRPGVSALLMRAMASAGISIRATAQGSSERQVSVVVDADVGTRALRAAHQAYSLSGRGVGVVVLGSSGRVGQEVAAQLQEQARKLRGEVDLKVLAAGDKLTLALDQSGRGLPLSRLDQAVRGAGRMDLGKITPHLQADANPHHVIVDCTDSEAVADRYAEWLARGFHVISSSALAGGGPMERYQSMQAGARRGGSQLRLGPSVGAGIRILKQLEDMRAHGANITRESSRCPVEAVLSGSLSFVFATASDEVPFASALTTAIRRGYTAVDPRDDLSGRDTAQRLLSLARHLALPLNLSDVSISSPLVPRRLQDWVCPTSRAEATAAFVNEMREEDFAWVDALVREAAAADEVVRHVAILSLHPRPALSVELRRYSRSHDFASCRTKDHVAAIHSDRAEDCPLVLQGAGIGAELVAAGVSSELVRLLSEI